jgi:hypothetical protein
MEPGLVLEKNLTIVSVVAFVVLQAERFKNKPAIINKEYTPHTMHIFLMINLLSEGIPECMGLP